MGKIILVTGSRTLRTCIPGQEFSDALLSADCIVAGDADGPDLWAFDIARKHRIRFDMWCVQGTWNGKVRIFLPDGNERSRDVGIFSSPLVRNHDMTFWCKQRKDEGHEVKGLSVMDLQSRTGGTKNTIKHMVKYGIPHSGLTMDSLCQAKDKNTL